MQSQRNADPMIFRLVLVFLLLALVIGAAGYKYYTMQQLHIKKGIQDELSAITDLKVDQLAAWRKERIGDAETITRNNIFPSIVRQFIIAPGSANLKQDLLEWMKALKDIYGYRSVTLIDTRGRVRLSTDSPVRTVGPHAKQLITESLRAQSVLLSDFVKSPLADYPHLNLAAPLVLRQGRSSIPVGAVLMRIDAAQFLYPLIQSWPGASGTAETLLVRKDGDGILYLNELRHRKNTALTLRRPLNAKMLPAIRALSGRYGIFEGVDYRDVPVLAATRPVPLTSWFLISKVDLEEIYAPLRRQTRTVSLVIALVIAVAGLSIVFWWRKKTEEYARARLKSEIERSALSRRYELLSKNANDIILLIDATGAIVEANDRALVSYGYTRDEFLRLNIRDLRPPETRREIDGQMETIRTRGGLVFESVHLRNDGSTFPVEVSSRVIDIEGKGIYQSIIRDISERKGMDAALKERNAFIEAILSNLPIGLAVNTIKDGKTIYLNTKFEEIYGWPQTIITDVEQFFTHVYPDPDCRKTMRKKIMSDIASNDPSRMRWENVRITTQTGDTKFVTAINIPLTGQGLMISTVMDVTARKQAEELLIENERRFKRLIESVTDYIYTVELEKGVAVKTTHGPGCMTVTGYTSGEFQADPGLWLRMIFEADRNAILELTDRLNSGETVSPFEHRIIHKNGSLRWIRNTPVPRYNSEGRLAAYDGMISDITPLKLLENQLRQAQKMEAVGQLAGGIAHDFNNILTAIIGYSHLLLLKLEPENPGRHFAEQIISSSERAAHLTQSLLAFSRKQLIDLKPVNVNDVVNRVEKLLTRVIGEDIDFKTSLTSADLTVLADGVQIEQVLMNLAANARDAMPDGGVFRIETSEMEMGEEYIRANSYGKPGTYACISVTDTGVGMDETTRARLFEPFYTTKEVGKGTGLGLSMVYGIVKQHNGYINVYSEQGKGANFKIYLPVIMNTADGKTLEAEPVPSKRGSETILLAEDDDTVRKLSRGVLEDSGYNVIEAVDGEDAVQKFSRNRDTINLLAFDIIMPRKSGPEAYQEIQKLCPGVKVLFMSGYSADLMNKKGLLETGLTVIPKPITPKDLLKKVREVLDEK